MSGYIIFDTYLTVNLCLDAASIAGFAGARGRTPATYNYAGAVINPDLAVDILVLGGKP